MAKKQPNFTVHVEITDVAIYERIFDVYAPKPKDIEKSVSEYLRNHEGCMRLTKNYKFKILKYEKK